MSRIRSVHPGFFTDEDLVSVSMAARLLFIGIGVEADDKGIFVWKPLTIKMRVFPADNVDVASLLCELVEAGLIKHYAVDGKSYGAIKNFRKYQRPKTPNDIHPATEDIISFVGLDQPNSEKKEVKEAPFPPEGEKSSQMEDEGGRKEKDDKPDGLPSLPAAPPKTKKSQSPKTKIPEDFAPTQFGIGTQGREIVDGWPPGEQSAQIEAFISHHKAHGKLMSDWQSAWSTWVINSRKFGKSNNGTGINANRPEPELNTVAQAALARRAERIGREQELF